MRVRFFQEAQQVTKSYIPFSERVTLLSPMETPKRADSITSFMSGSEGGCKEVLLTK